MKVYEEACSELNYVYCGNLPVSYNGSDTKCPSCGTVVISRYGYKTEIKSLRGNKCGNCGHAIYGIFE
jgi:pyruvate formate lyase activating enzyme